MNNPRITSATMRFAAILLATALTFACSKDRSQQPMSALLVTLDTTRADALGCYGRVPAVTPNLDSLAREGVLFENAHCTAPSTLPSHASMLTGLYPIRHSARHNGLQPLPQSARTLAESAKEKGFETAAFIGSIVLADSFGLDQGFEVYDQPRHGEHGATTQFDERRASEVIDAALSWLKRRDRARPFFMWVHLYDAHMPYAPPKEFQTGALAREPYLGEISFADHELGRLLAALREQEVLDRVAVLAIADHGEAFGEHGETTHGVYCYESTLRVPLILRMPGGEHGIRKNALVSGVDVYPTLAEAMGLAVPSSGEIDGVSLFAPKLDRGIYFESYYAWNAYGWSPIAGWLDGQGKYLHSSTPEFFDLTADPGEANNLASQRDSARYKAAISALAARPALVEGDAHGIDEALKQKIRGLGYAGVEDVDRTVPSPLADTGRPSPAQRSTEYRRLNEATGLLNEGRHSEAAAKLDLVLAVDPDNLEAIEYASVCAIETRRYAEAIPFLKRMVASGRARAPTHYNLGIALAETGRTDEAIASYRRALELAPNEPRILKDLIPLYRRAGREAEAKECEAKLGKIPGR